MIGSWQEGLLIFFRTVSQILTAGIAITAFALLLYALTFNLRDRVARSFAFIMLCVVIVFSADAIGSTSAQLIEVNFWLRLQWIGILFIPPSYLHFSDALLATTGKPSRWRRYWAVRISYIISAIFLFLLALDRLVGPVIVNDLPAPHLQATLLTDAFILFYILLMVLAWINFTRAYRRTTTPTSRRRMGYLILAAVSPALGAFPFLLYSSDFAGRHTLLFWFIAALSSLLLGSLIIVMAYSVAFFGVPWPDRVVKSRLFKWILRGPVMASFVLALTTVVRRLGEAFGSSYTALVPITMVTSILMAQYLITLFSPLWEKYLFYGKDQNDLSTLRHLEDRLLTRNDLQQFMEMILAAVQDKLQAPGAYVAALNEQEMELVITTGKAHFDDADMSETLFQMVTRDETLPQVFRWGNDYVIPLVHTENDHKWELLGLLGVSGASQKPLDDEENQTLALLAERATMALYDRRMQQQVFLSLESLSTNIDMIQRIRASGRYDRQTVMLNDVPEAPAEITQSVKEALTHYWGGPKLTESPLMGLRVVQEAIGEHEGNHANALRSILRQAVERVRPEGERRFTAEWILYNILDMKFIEGRKVREVAMRLAMSEADLYRKQRIAIEAVAKAILDMETQVHEQNG
jgi:hypothetical protein